MKLQTLLLLALSFFASLAAHAEQTKAPTELTTWLETNLVASNGTEVTATSKNRLGQADYIALYFSAHWCPPCKVFTPKLVNFYNEQSQKHENFELVFVSSDRSAQKLEEYMLEVKMPWPAVKFENKDNRHVRQFSGSGIPCLVIVDRDGKVIEHTEVDGEYLGPTRVMNELEKLLN